MSSLWVQFICSIVRALLFAKRLNLSPPWTIFLYTDFRIMELFSTTEKFGWVYSAKSQNKKLKPPNGERYKINISRGSCIKQIIRMVEIRMESEKYPGVVLPSKIRRFALQKMNRRHLRWRNDVSIASASAARDDPFWFFPPQTLQLVPRLYELSPIDTWISKFSDRALITFCLPILMYNQWKSLPPRSKFYLKTVCDVYDGGFTC